MADINVVVDSPPNYPVTVSNSATTAVTIVPPPALNVVLDNGRQGPPGVGIPTGGTTDQVLAKKSNLDYDTKWIYNNSNPEVSAGVAAPTAAPLTIPALYLQEIQPHPILWAYYGATVGWETVATGSSAVDQFRQLTDVIFASTTTNTYSSDTVGVQQIIGLRQTSATTWVIDYSGAQIGGLQVGNLISATNTGNPILYTIGNLFWAGNVGAITVNKDPSQSWTAGAFSIYKVTQTTSGPADKSVWWYRTASDKLEAFSIDAEIQSATTNTLVSNGNVLTSTVNGHAATANTVKSNAIVKINSNNIETAVNSVGSNAIQLVETNTLNISGNSMTSSVNGVTAISDIVSSVTLATGATAGTLRASVNGVASNDFTLPATGVTIAQVDAEIAAKVGSINQAPTTLVTTGLQTTTGAFGTQGSVTTCNIATASHDAGRTFLTSIGCTLSGTTWSTPTNPTYIGISATPNANAVAMILGAQDANNILQLDLQTNAVLAALHSGPYTLFSATGLFNFEPAPLAAIDREIASRTATNEGIFNLAQPLNADNVGLLVKIVSTNSALSNVVGSVNNSADFGAVTITSAGFPPTPPTGFNTQYVGISSADNRTWGGVGRIASGNTGIEQIAWKIAPPSGLNFTDARIWSMVDEAASSWVGQTLIQSQENGPVTSHLFPEATVTYSDDNLGTYNGAANITYKPFVDNEISAQLVAGTNIGLATDPVTKRVTITNTGSTGVTAINNLTGSVLVSSPDNSINIGTAGQTIELQTAQTGGAGVATGYNVGEYVPTNILVYHGGQTPPSTAANEGQVQLGTGTGYSTSTGVIAPAPAASPTQGWTFGGQKANNVVLELGAQKQIFRLGVSGTWSVTPQVLPIYGGSAVIKQPNFLKYNTDYDSGSPFPGLTTASGSSASLVERSPVNATARYCTNTGLACQTISIAVPSFGNVTGIGSVGGTSGSPVLVFNTTTTLTDVNLGNTSGAVTLPLEVFVLGQWIYLGAEWQISAYTLATNQVQITLTDAGTYLGNAVRIKDGLSTPMLAWYSGLPPAGTAFGADLLAAHGYVEVHLPANIWTADTATYSPQGFTLPTSASAPQGYNFNWTVVTGANKLNTLDYWHYNLADQYDPDPNNIPNWNNRITINYGSSGSSIPGNLWDTWVLNWTGDGVSSVKPTVLSGAYTDPNGNSGKVIRYAYGGVIRYRFVPTTYAPNLDAFYSTLTGSNVTGLLTARSS